MNSRTDQFQADLVVVRKIALERNQNCLAFLIEGFFSSIFLFILDRILVLLQAPVVLSFFILYMRPSFSKDLIFQQKLCLVALGLAALKSLFIIINMIIYLVYFFGGNPLPQLYTASGAASIFRIYTDNVYLFPDLGPKSGSGSSSFLSGVLIVIFALMTLFEILSIYVSYFIMKKTQKIIAKLQSIRVPEVQSPNLVVQGVGENEPNDREESASLQPMTHSRR